MNVERRAGGNGSTPEVELVWPKAPSALLGLLSMPLFTFSVLSGLRNSSTFPWPSSLQSWSLSCAQLFVTHWTVDHQVPLSMGFLRQEYQSGLPFPSPGYLPDPGMEPVSPALQVDSLPAKLSGKPLSVLRGLIRVKDEPVLQGVGLHVQEKSFARFSNYYGVNTSNSKDFKLSMQHHWEEKYTVEFYKPVPASSSTASGLHVWSEEVACSC